MFDQPCKRSTTLISNAASAITPFIIRAENRGQTKIGVRSCIEIQSPRSPLKHNQPNTIER
jgi:hypothetical protein